MSGSSRKDSGVGSKSRYPSLNLSHSYKGPGHDYKSNQKRGAMQSLGKISTNARRMPVPAQLRSLKSSNDGQDPSVALVPQGGGGWTKDEEKEKEKEDPLNYTRKTEKPQKTVVPEGFKTNFPSLEEQEKMSKKEREELEKRQREEENCDDESKESPPPAQPPSSRGHHSRKQPKEAWGGNQEEPPYHHGGGQPQSHTGGPIPQGLYHQRRADRQPYMSHPRTGRYPSGPPSYHQNPHYRHTAAPYPHHHGYPQPHPPFIDPYSIPPKDPSANPRPTIVPTGLESSMKDSEQELEDDDDGWAGHQEEVDYSKEVVFEDSSDEDSPKKGQKEQSKARTNIDEERTHHNTQESSSHRHHSKQDPARNMPHPPHGGHAPYPKYDYHHPPPMPYPPYPPGSHAGWYPPYHQQQGRGDHSYDQDPNRPPGGRPPPQTTNMEGKNRRNQHPAWSESSHGDYTNWSRSDGGSKNDGDQMTADKVSKNQTHFESVQSPIEPEPLVTPSTDMNSMAIRNQPKKIMMRDLGDKVEGGNTQQHGQRAAGDKDVEGDNLKKVVWGGVKSQTTQPLQDSSGYQKNESPVPPIDEPQAVLKDRGSVQSSKTLYEPEGRTSQEKFRKYQRSMSGGGGAAEHHTHGKHKKTSRSDSRGSEGDGKSPISMADETTTEDEKKQVLIKKHEDKVDGNPPATRGREKSWKGDGKRDRDAKGGSGRYRDEEKRRGGPVEKGANDRRRDSQRDETNQQHEPRGNTKPHPSSSSHHTTKRTKSEEEYKQPSQPQRGSGKGQQDSKVSHKQNTTTAKPVSSNKRQNDRHDSADVDNSKVDGSYRTRNNADKPESRTHPSRRTQTEVTRPDRQDRNKPPRQDGSHHDTRAPQSHSKQSDSRYPPQDQVRGSGSKSRKEHQSTQNTSEGTHSYKSRPVQSHRGQQKERQGYKETVEDNEDDDNVFEDQQSSAIDQHGLASHQDTKAGRSSKPSKTGNESKQKDTKQDPVSSRPSRQDPVPSRPNPVPSRQGAPSRQDPGFSHSTRPNRSRDYNKHDSSNRFNEPHSKPEPSSSRKGFKHRQDPNPSVQDPIPPRHDSRQDPNPLRQDLSKHDSNPLRPDISRQDPNPPRQDPNPPRQDPNPPRQDSNPSKQESNSSRQDPNTPRLDPNPPRLDPDPLKQEPKQESRWDPPLSAKQDRERHHNREPKPSKDENTRSRPKPETKEPDQKRDSEYGGSRRRQEYEEYDQDYSERYNNGGKRRSNTREERGGHSGRGRGGRWGRGYVDYEDDEYRSTTSFRRSNRRYEEEELDNYPSRTFDRSKRGGGRGRERRGGGSARVGRDGNNDKEASENKDTTNKGEEKSEETEVKQPTVMYTGLDDIDSASDWDEDKEGGEGGGADVPSNNRRKLSENDRPRYRERGGGARKYSRNYDRNKRNERYRDEGTGSRGGQRQQHHGSSNMGKKDVTDADKETPPNPDPPVSTTKDPNFNKYDINAHNVVVVDRRNSLSDGEGQFVGVADEGFIKVKSKRDKHKDREERKKTDGNSKRGDEHSGRHKGFLGRGPEQNNNGGKGWGHVQQKKTDSISREGNGDWPLNEGRSAYGAIGDKPSKEKGFLSDDTRKTTNLSSNPGYKLFETEDNKGKNTAFGFDSPLSKTPGERLREAIDITLPQNMTHITNEQSTIVSNVSTSQKGHDLSSTENVAISGVKSSKEQLVSKNVEESEPHSRIGGGGRDNKHRKAKTEQRFYTPPGARPDTGPRGQRSHASSSKHGNTSTTHSKVHHHDDPGDHQMGDALEEDSSPSSRHHDNTKKETAVVRGVYLQQHQGLGGGHIMMSDDASNQDKNDRIVSSNIDTNGPHPFDSVNENNDNESMRKVHVLKELAANKAALAHAQSSVSSTKFGSVSYASALKMKAQVKSIKGGGGVIIDEAVSSDMANLLSPKLSRRSGDGLLVNYTGDESDCASGGAGEFDSIIPLHDVLREAVLTHSDENEVDGGSTHRYTPSSPRQSEDTIQSCYPVPVASCQPPGVSKPLSPSTPFTKPFSPPVGGGALGGPYTKPSPLYSGIGVSTGEGSSLGVEQSSPSYTSEKEPEDMATGGGSVVKQLLKEESVRPSSAQSLSESPFITRLQQSGYGSGMGGGGESSPHGGSGNTSGGLPLTRVSSAPSHLPLNDIEQNEIVESDDTESVKTDDSISTSSKSILNIEANEFVPNQLARKRPSSQYSNQQKPQTRSVRGYQGQRTRGGGPPVQNHQKGHTSHGGKHYQHRHTPQQQPHSPNQQQSLLNKPPLDVLLQLFLNLKNVPLLQTGGLAIPPTPPTMPVPLSPLQTSQSVPHPSLPLNFPPMSSGSGMPYPVTHPPPAGGVPMTQSRKMSQEGVVPPPPHASGMPHPSLASAPPLQYITTGSKVGGTAAPPSDSGTPDVGQVSNMIPSGNHPPPPPPYFTATPLHPNQTPSQMPTVIFPPHHPNHHLPSTRSSHATPINGPQVPQPLAIIPSLQLAPPRPPPVMVDQQTNSNNSRPPLLPTPPGFNLLHQSTAAATPTVMTPSIHHPNWPVNPPIRLGLPPNMQSHDRSSIIQFPHMPQSN